MNKKAKVSFLSFGAFVVAIFAVIGFFLYQFTSTGYSDDNTEVIFEVFPGQNMKIVSENLEKNNLVKSGWMFFQYSRFMNMNSKLKRGEYAVRANMTPIEILGVVTSGKSIARNLTVIEGANIFDVADVFEKNGFGTRAEFLALLKDKEFIKSLLGEDLESLEGYLYPETYKFTKFEGAREIIKGMVRKFLSVWTELEPMTKTSNWPRNKIITFASIVEKETGHAEDRALVSSVFHNRLNKNMRLQTDPTILYGLAYDRWQNNLTPEVVNNISKADLRRPHRYNSYTNYGLPPTPISNPSRDAILATLNPAPTKYLYFVSRNDGTTQFSETLSQHNMSVRAFQIDPKAREGKSWRDLSKPKEVGQ